MTDFIKRARATLSPTQCAFCGDTEGPFIDTGVEYLGYGRIWICAANERRSGCIRQMARLDGMFDPTERDQLLDEIVNLTHKVEELRDALGERKVPVGKVFELLRE